MSPEGWMLQHALTPEFSCDVRPDRERVVVALGGELDLAAAPDVAATVDDLLDVGFGRIVVDLRRLTFVDSAGIHTLIAAKEGAERRGSALSLLRGSRDVHRVFELTAADSLLCFDDAGEGG
jgi:anti-sigma B factor antagonist